MPGFKKMSATRFTLHKAAQEWGIHRETLGKRLKAHGIEPDEKDQFSIQQIDQAIHGDLDEERAGLVREQRELTRVNRMEKLRELVPIAMVDRVWCRVILEYRQRVMSANIPDPVKKDLLEPLAQEKTNAYFEEQEQSEDPKE